MIQKRYRGVLGRRKAALRAIAVQKRDAAKMIQCAYRRYRAAVTLDAIKRTLYNNQRVSRIRKDRAFFLRMLGVQTRKRGKNGQKVGLNAVIDMLGLDPITFQFYPKVRPYLAPI